MATTGLIFRPAAAGARYEKGALFSAVGPTRPGQAHLQFDRDELALVGGLAAIGLGLFVYLHSQSQPHCPSGYVLQNGECVVKPPPPPPPPPPTHCLTGHAAGSLVTPSRFYNWGDLRVLPLRPSDPHTWSTGGTTTELGWLPGTTVNWTEAKYGRAGDGRTDWFVRVSNPGWLPGDWALPAGDLNVTHPCG